MYCFGNRANFLKIRRPYGKGISGNPDDTIKIALERR